MKKVTKLLITAAAVAAVAGVSAVSFAAWSGGSATGTTVTGNVGEIVVLSGELSASTNLNGKVLVPHDQSDQYDATKMAKEMTITLEYNGAAGAIIKMQASGDVSGKLEYQKADNSWAGFTTEVVVNAATVKDTDTTVKVRLNSSDTDDMKGGYTITFSVEAPTVSGS